MDILYAEAAVVIWIQDNIPDYKSPIVFVVSPDAADDEESDFHY